MVSVKTIHFKFSKFWLFNFSTKLPNLIFLRTFLWNLNYILSYQKDVILNCRWMKKKNKISDFPELIVWFSGSESYLKKAQRFLLLRILLPRG